MRLALPFESLDGIWQLGKNTGTGLEYHLPQCIIMYHHVSCGNAIKHPQVATGVCENGYAQEKKDDLQQSEAHMVG